MSCTPDFSSKPSVVLSKVNNPSSTDGVWDADRSDAGRENSSVFKGQGKQEGVHGHVQAHSDSFLPLVLGFPRARPVASFGLRYGK